MESWEKVIFDKMAWEPGEGCCISWGEIHGYLNVQEKETMIRVRLGMLEKARKSWKSGQETRWRRLTLTRKASLPLTPGKLMRRGKCRKGAAEWSSGFLWVPSKWPRPFPTAWGSLWAELSGKHDEGPRMCLTLTWTWTSWNISLDQPRFFSFLQLGNHTRFGKLVSCSQRRKQLHMLRSKSHRKDLKRVLWYSDLLKGGVERPGPKRPQQYRLGIWNELETFNRGSKAQA